MKSFKKFISESINVAGDFNGNLYVNSSDIKPEAVAVLDPGVTNAVAYGAMTWIEQR